MTRIPIVIILIIAVAGVFDLVLSPEGDGPARDGSQVRRPDPQRFERRSQQQRQDQWKAPDRSAGRGSLAAPSARDPAFNVAVPETKGNSIGTAFSLDRRGIWMTARHVVDGCSRVLIVTKPGRGVRVSRIFISRRADLAVLQTRGGSPSVRFTQSGLKIGQTGYHFGYPKGKPSAVKSTLIGRRRMRSSGRYSVVEPVVAWAEQVRVPDTFGGLGGISGGPAFDSNGNIIGVTVAGTKRRGRVYTTALTSIAAALNKAGVSVERGAGRRGEINNRNFAEIGAEMRQKLTVALVYCAAPGGQRSGQQQGQRRGRGINPRRPGPPPPN